MNNGRRDKSAVPRDALILRAFQGPKLLHRYGASRHAESIRNESLQRSQCTLYPALDLTSSTRGALENNRRPKHHSIAPGGICGLENQADDWRRLSSAFDFAPPTLAGEQR